MRGVLSHSLLHSLLLSLLHSLLLSLLLSLLHSLPHFRYFSGALLNHRWGARDGPERGTQWWKAYKERHKLENTLRARLEAMPLTYFEDEQMCVDPASMRALCPEGRPVSDLRSWAESLAYLDNVLAASEDTHISDKFFAQACRTAIYRLCAQVWQSPFFLFLFFLFCFFLLTSSCMLHPSATGCHKPSR